jgi:hypothetical protein
VLKRSKRERAASVYPQCTLHVYIKYFVCKSGTECRCEARAYCVSEEKKQMQNASTRCRPAYACFFALYSSLVCKRAKREIAALTDCCWPTSQRKIRIRWTRCPRAITHCPCASSSASASNSLRTSKLVVRFAMDNAEWMKGQYTIMSLTLSSKTYLFSVND